MEDISLALRELSDADVDVRRRASLVLEREARKVSVQRRKDALGNRTATHAIRRALADPDRVVAQNAVIALAEISRRYFKDDDAYPAVALLLTSPDQLTRQWAARAAVTLRGEASWPDVAPLLQDRSAKVRAAVTLLATHRTTNEHGAPPLSRVARHEHGVPPLSGVARHEPGANLILDVFVAADAPVLCAGDHDPEHRRRFDFPDDFVPSLAHAEQVIAQWDAERRAGTRFPFAVRDADTSELLGGVELQPRSDGVANLSYWTYPAHRGKGVASRAIALAVEVAFTELGLTCLEVLTAPDNHASRRAALRNGFQEAGEREGEILHLLFSESGRSL